MADRAFIIDSARQHGVADDDIWHAYRHPVRRAVYQDDGVVVRYGYDVSGRLIEVAFIIRHDGVHVIIHALRRRRLPSRR